MKKNKKQKSCLTSVCVDKQNCVLVVEIGQNEMQKILVCDAKLRTLEKSNVH